MGKTKRGLGLFSQGLATPRRCYSIFVKPVSGGQLKVTLEQEYGQGLLFEKFRLSASAYPTKWLTPELKPMQGIDRLFEKVEYPANP